MLVGRAPEQGLVDQLLADTRAGRGGGLVLRGEPGIGKSALLDYAAGQATGMRVLRVAGVQSESTLAYAALHQLLRPVLDRLDRLPEPQSAALRTAFGLDSRPVQPFAVSAGALTLLSDAAEDRPVLCLVDDAQWSDPHSLGAFTFVARRLEAESVALVLAVRDGEGRSVDPAGLRELSLSGLDDAAAADLLGDRVGAQLRDRVLRSMGGNPLALLELPGEPAGSVHEPVPLAGELERAFLARTRRHRPEVQTLLLLAAAEGAGRRAHVRRAAAALGIDADPLDTPELAGLLRVDADRISFRHTLVRSAVYHGASGRDRRDAHRALAAALADEPALADLRAWHRAEAAEGPDESAAADLERSADQAVRRSGHLVAAAALDRAAELSESTVDRARRLVAAAEAYWHGGDTASAVELLNRAETPRPEEAVALRISHLRGAVELRAGAPDDAVALLLPASARAVEVDAGLALQMLLLAREAAASSADTGLVAEADRLVARLPTLDSPQEELISRALRVFNRPTRAHHEAAAVVAGLAGLEREDDPDLLRLGGGLAWAVGDYALSKRLRAKAVDRARTLGAAGTLAAALEYLVPEELARGHLASAEAHAAEGRRLAAETGRPNSASLHVAYLAQLAGLRGRADEARTLAEQALTDAVSRRLVKVADTALRALGLLALAERRPEDAVTAFRGLDGTGPVPGSPLRALTSVPDRIEAEVRAGETAAAKDILPGYLSWVDTFGSPELHALAARSRALLATDDAADREFRAALRQHAGTDRPFDHARTQLLYGEFLRRERQRIDARAQLRSAMDTFARLGTPIWAERAATELRATGETARKRAPDTFDQLTPQELQIAQAVGQGATNREIAAQLFLSPRTVDYHLRKVFRKLGVSSRRELIKLAPGTQ